MRLGIVILFWVFTLNIYAQNPADTAITLQEVTVVGNFEKQFLPGNTIIFPKAKTLKFYQSDNISEVLKQQSSIHFKQYGTGISTIAFRGTSASQTSVLWNNFNINSYTLGMTDFSLIPMQAIGEITIIPGSGSSLGGNGAFGGAVLLQNPIDYDTPHQISLQQQLGSFKRINSAINAKGSLGKFAYNTRIYWNKAENDFPVPGKNKKQDNAAFESYGINQSMGYQINTISDLKAAVWFSDNYREIQPLNGPVGGVSLNDQTDKNLRTTLSYNLIQGNTKLALGTGFFVDEMTYRRERTVSYLQVKRLESFANYKYRVSVDHQLKFTARHNYINAENDSYEEGGVAEHRYSLGLLLKGSIKWGIDYALHLRQQLVTGVKIPLSPYVGLSKKLINEENNKLTLKANTSYNYRLPTFNDRFYNELGNPELDSETAWNKEISVESKHSWSGLKFNTSLTVYHNHVNNWIQWTPDVLGDWRPMNINEVVAKGVESELGLSLRLASQIRIEAGLQYSHTKSTVVDSETNPNEIGNQLIYTPFNKATASFSVYWKNFSLDAFNQLTGKVYTTVRNSEVFTLESFSLSDLGLNWHSDAWQLSGRVKNVFNKSYQMYSGYAMPGRNYQLSITYQLKFTKQ